MSGSVLLFIAAACSGSTFTGTEQAAGTGGTSGGASGGKGGKGGQGGSSGSSGKSGSIGGSGGSDSEGGSSGSGTGGSSGSDGTGGSSTGGDSSSGGDSSMGGAGGSGGSGQGGTAGDAGSSQGGTAGDAGSGQGGTAGVVVQGGASGALAGVGGAVAGAGNSSGTGGATTTGGAGGVSGGVGGVGGVSGGVGGVGGATGGVGGASGGTGGNIGGTGGSVGGSAGANTSGAECDSDSDCQIVSDCCTCESVPKGAPLRTCGLVCVISACESLMIGSDEAACRFGRCVIDRSCDSTEVTCESVTPQCEAGSIPSVIGTCWGPCLPSTECREVTSCADCADSVCVENETQLPTTGCVVPEQGCNAGEYCQCLGACMASAPLCDEHQSGVSCSCPNCSN